jgi:ABC-type multidrug transport system fused ATPase/permease subunit
MFVCGLVGWFVTFVSKVAFAAVGENITINIRSHLYSNVLQKHMGWHDDSSNAAGVISAILASDVQMLNGASSEAIAAMAEGLFGLIWGVIIGFFFSWRVALVALALTPLMTIGGAVQAKVNKQDNFENKETEEADLLANDCISNYRTVTSFGAGDKIVNDFR